MRFFWFVILPAVLLGTLASSLPVAIYAAVFGAVLMAVIAPSDKDNDNGNGNRHADRGGDSGERRRYLSDRVDDLEYEVRELRQRLAALERRQSMPAAMPEQQAAQKQPAPETPSLPADEEPLVWAGYELVPESHGGAARACAVPA